MVYRLEDINRRVLEDPERFVQECDTAYEKNVLRAAEAIVANIERSRIVLLSGPSGSGKTTTAKNIELALKKFGIVTHTISLDNYYKDVDPEKTPRNADGIYDFESPELLDTELLVQQFLDLDQKGNQYTKFEFKNQKRNPIKPCHYISTTMIEF